MVRVPEDDPTLYTLRRRQKSEHIDLDRIVVPPFEHDPRFDLLYREFLDGRGVAGITRLRHDRIEAGFRRSFDNALVVDDVRADHVIGERAQIRAGGRGVLWVYRQKNSVNGLYSCPDDVTLLKAYEAEGISVVPCMVLDPEATTLDHSALLVRSLSTGSDHQVLFTGILQVAEPKLALLLHGIETPTSVEISLGFRDLQAHLLKALRRLRRYHRDRRSAPHYHHSMASSLTRAARLLEALDRLDATALPDVAAVIIRALYELWLSLYVDWLAPEFAEPAFQIHATFTRQQRRIAIREKVDAKRVEGWSERAVREYATALERLFHLVESPAERAKVSPGASIHNKIYPHLCQYVHQDFAAGSTFLRSLSECVSPKHFSGTLDPDATFLLQVADIAVGGMVACVSEDTGITERR
jgi:hypothetical protein